MKYATLLSSLHFGWFYLTSTGFLAVMYFFYSMQLKAGDIERPSNEEWSWFSFSYETTYRRRYEEKEEPEDGYYAELEIYSVPLYIVGLAILLFITNLTMAIMYLSFKDI